MISGLRSILRRVAATLRPTGWEQAAIPAERVDLMLRAIAANARRPGDAAHRPPAVAMLEVLLRELTTNEMAAAVERMDAADRAEVETVLAAPLRAGPPRPEAAPVLAAGPAAEPVRRSVATREIAELPETEATRLRHARLESLLVQGDARLERDVLDRLKAGEFDSRDSAWALGQILEGSVDEQNRKRAISMIRPDPFSKARTIRTLAEIAAWGIERGRELTGKSFRFRLYGTGAGEVGMTYLRGRTIHFNPLPLLRGETDGRRIVEAIILHEIGHHRYDTGPEWDDLAKEIAEENLHSLLNLVQDEHLERNLRSIDTNWGDSLKILAAWAFQRTNREIDVHELLTLLGPHAFPILVRAGLEPARERTKVAINSGRLLREMEAHGSSFSRFLRALRMGLGNRSGDPKVAEALTLFGRSFRDAKPAQLLSIARELRRIFGDDSGVCDVLSLHGAATADSDELAGRLPGISDEELTAEIDSIRRGAHRPGTREKSKDPGKVINRGESTEFSEINEVVTLDFDRAQFSELAKGVAGWSRRLRRFLQSLGLSRITIRRRTAGTAVDRPALQRAIVGGDPRVLMSRRTIRTADLFLGVVIDCSGSMASAGSMDRAQLFAALIAEAARGLPGIDARFFGFTDEVLFDAGTAAHCAVAALDPQGGNNDAAALWYVSRVAMASRRSARLLVMISDGAPTECSVEALRALVKRLTSGGIACAQVAVQPITEVCFPDYVLVDDENLSDAVGRFGRIIVKLVRKVI
ncbi:MAG TPA: hypothetical protein VF432_15035 [Thermoanaerobaculia bacterium]